MILRLALALSLASPLAAAAATPAAGTPAQQPSAPAAEGMKGDAAAAPQKPAGEMHAYFQAPLFSETFGATPVATVAGEPITLEQLTDALALSHTSRQATAAKEHDFRPVLDRLIDMKLCVVEARDMGLEDLPEAKEVLVGYRDQILRDQYEARATKDVKPDPEEVERLTRDAVREWKIRSVLFEKEADAKAFATSVGSGKAFEAEAKPLLEAKKAKGSLDAQFAPTAQLLPAVAQVLAATPIGKTTPPLRVEEGWSLMQVVDVRYPEDPKARAGAEQTSLDAQRARALDALYGKLVKNYARVDQKLLSRLDFEAKKPGFTALLKDQRTLARIEGEKPVAVGDVTLAIARKFFHGIDGPIKEHKVNVLKLETFHALMRKRLFLHDARATGVPESREYQRALAEYRDATLFGAFLEKAIMPDVQVSEAQGRAYYDQHKAEFGVPAMYKLESLTFARAPDAQAALQKLRSGTDFKWLRQNADGQVPEEKRITKLDNVVLSATGMSPALAELLSNAKQGDYRLFDDGDQHHVVRIAQLTPGGQRSYEEARAAIGKKLIGENLNKAVTDYAAKLRKAHEVKIYLDKIAY